MIEIIEKPFDWNDNLSEIAKGDFSMIQKSLSYGTATTIYGTCEAGVIGKEGWWKDC